MKHCKKCDVDVDDSLVNCPLCGAFLTEEDRTDQNDDAARRHEYPALKVQRSRKIFFKISVFLSILAMVVCAVVDLAVNNKISWSVHVFFAFALLWATVGRTIFQRMNVRKHIAWDSIAIVALCFYIEHFTDTAHLHWAFRLAAPILVLTAATVHEILFFANWRNRGNYEMALTKLAVLSAICIGISWLWLKECGWGWYVCTARGIVDVFALAIFARKSYFTELKMRLHI